MTEKKTGQPEATTIITLTLPEKRENPLRGTLLIQRSDLACIRQFAYTTLSNLPEVIKEAFVALAAIEANPPKEMSKSAPAQKRAAKAPEVAPNGEPMVDVPLKSGTLAVKKSHLQMTDGDNGVTAYDQAVLVAGRLIDGKLWDGKTPIRIVDVSASAGKLKHLTDRDLSMFELTDFAQVGETNASSDVAGDEQNPGKSTEDPHAEAQLPAISDPSDPSALI